MYLQIILCLFFSFIKRECLEELVEYHRNTKNESETQRFSMKLDNLGTDQTNQTNDPPNNNPDLNSQPRIDDEGDCSSHDTRLTEAMQVLSSDSGRSSDGTVTEIDLLLVFVCCLQNGVIDCLTKRIDISLV